MRLALWAAVMFGGVYLAALAHGQEGLVRVGNDAFESPSRPEALFDHDAHTEKVSISDCASCHHAFENGILQEGESSEGTPCSECHLLSRQGSTPGLMRAYHLRCTGCHRGQKSGPLMCGECHQR